MDSYLTRSYIIDIYNNPKNYGDMKDFDILEEGENPLCGDSIKIYVKYKGDIIEDISFVSNGCIISKVAASILTQEVKGKSINDIKKIDFSLIKEKMLMDISFSREKCARLSFEILQKIIEK